MSLPWIIIIILILLVAIYIGIYNGLQKAKVHADEAWSQIDVQLKRRVGKECRSRWSPYH